MTPDEYRRQNPLGGPAKMFDTIADRIRAGEDLASVMDDYGISFNPSARPTGCAEHLDGPLLSVRGETKLTTVGELRELLTPFTDECPLSALQVRYVSSGAFGAWLRVDVLHNDKDNAP